ncbi:hypothetical protein ONE63_002759 [Megalurothrips usitatus]|uniref:DUF4708 domain-containing protein n=1 Tax=Megalurothrips usitatus TaxID=439358 RepID=A0AAV7X557_9NEOP|nr:hypothetical protein ONE63_002759 [Megalurothrips usitatus]
MESDPVLAKMAVPAASELFCFTATIDRREDKDPSARSDFHWQIIKCRMLLFATSSVLVCPVRPLSGPRRELAVVCRREDIADVSEVGVEAPPRSPLLDILGRLRLAVSRLRPVSDAEYSACLRYTITARLSPLWNPLGEDERHLIQGRHFLSGARGRAADAVRLEVIVHGEAGAAWLSFSAVRLRVAPLTFTDIDVAAGALDRLHRDPLAVVSSVCIGQPWVRVLPSLKKGVVMEISRTLPEDCPFSSYKNIRRHWKNMYGYRLAEDASDVVFVSIYFSMMGGAPMTYPMSCLTPRPPTPLRSPDPRAVAVAFLGDVAARVATVCGAPSPVAADGLSRPVATLLSCGTDSDSDAEAGAAGAHPNLRPLAENTNGYSSSSATPPREGASTPSTCPLSLATQRDGTRPRVEWNVLKRAPRGDDKENVPPEVRLGAAAVGCEARAVFTIFLLQDAAPPPPPHRPVFGARAPVSVQPRLARPVPVVPASVWFNPPLTSTPTKDRRSPASSASSAAPRSSASCTSAPAPYAPVFRVPAHKPIFLALPKAKKTPAQAAPRPRPRPRPVGTTSPRLGARAAPTGTAGTSARKTGASGERSSSEAPLVPELATADAARRASIPMLLAWLRGRGLPCRAKDKKDELVEKVVSQLGGR